MSISTIKDIPNSLNRINQQKNAENKGKFYTYQVYTEVTQTIFDQHAKNVLDDKLKPNITKQLSASDEPMIEIAHAVAKILYNKKEKGPHADLANKITALKDLRGKMQTQGNVELTDYCATLIDECILTLKKIDQSEITKKTTSLKLKELFKKEPAKLSDADYEQLWEKSEQLDKFFSSFEKYSKNQPKEKKFYEEFVRVWTLSLNKCFHSNPKKERKSRIAALKESTANLPEAFAADKATFNSAKANLNFILAFAILAKELKKSSPSETEIAKAKQLLEESAPFSEPARMASQFDFKDWKNFKLKPKEMEASYKEMRGLIKAAGCEKFISKRDLKEVFTNLSPEAVTKAKTIHILKTIAGILTLPIIWSATLALALAFLIVAILTYPVWATIGE